MLGAAPRLALAAPAIERPTEASRREHALFFDAGGPRWPREAAEPSRRPSSPQAVFWSWIAIAVLIAALVLPFSLAALVDLVSYLRR